MREYKNIENLARMIDISAVRADSTTNEIDNIIKLLEEYNFICAFALPSLTPYLLEKIKPFKETIVGGPVGFPSGGVTTNTKIIEAKELMDMGCKELDMVINIGALKSGMNDLVYNDIKAVVDTANNTPVKCILETTYLSDDEIKKGSELAVKAGVKYVKTGTGWSKDPTTINHIKLIKDTIGDSALIKAAGGVRDLNTLYDMIDAGCSRFGIGLSSCIKIMNEADEILSNKKDIKIKTDKNDNY